MSGRRLSIRLNLDKLNHKKAYDILATLPKGRKSEYVVSSIIKAYDTDEVLEMVRQVLSENSNNGFMSIKSGDGIDNIALDYIKTL